MAPSFAALPSLTKAGVSRLRRLLLSQLFVRIGDTRSKPRLRLGHWVGVTVTCGMMHGMMMNGMGSEMGGGGRHHERASGHRFPSGARLSLSILWRQVGIVWSLPSWIHHLRPLRLPAARRSHLRGLVLPLVLRSLRLP